MTYYEKLSLENYFGANQQHHHPNHHLNHLNHNHAANLFNHPSTASMGAIVIDKGAHHSPFELAAAVASASLTKFNYVPAIVPIPTIRADDRDLALKVSYLTRFSISFKTI